MIAKTLGGFYISQIKQVSSRIFEKLLKANAIDAFNGPQGRTLFVLWQEDILAIPACSIAWRKKALSAV